MKKLIKTNLLVILVVFICGCAIAPFRHSDYPAFDDVDPQALLTDFAARLPGEFEILNSVIFKYRHLRFSALGVTGVDTNKGLISTVGFNHLGILLFDLTLDDERIESRYVFPEFSKRGDFAGVMLRDIKNIYFERIPLRSSEVKKSRRKIVFRKNTQDGILEHVFSGEGRFLAEKNYYEGKRLLWSVSYYNYVFNNGKIYPKNIVLKHRKHGYELVIKLREIR